MTMPLLLLLVLVALALAAPRYGVDTRDSADWNPARRYDEPAPVGPRHTVRGDLAALGARLARAFSRPQHTDDQAGHCEHPATSTSTV